MNCPRCGHEMVLDEHRKIPLHMCYTCGYIEGRSYDGEELSSERSYVTNFEHARTLNYAEMVSFICSGLNLDTDVVSEWLEKPYKA